MSNDAEMPAGREQVAQTFLVHESSLLVPNDPVAGETDLEAPLPAGVALETVYGNGLRDALQDEWIWQKGALDAGCCDRALAGQDHSRFGSVAET